MTNVVAKFRCDFIKIIALDTYKETVSYPHDKHETPLDSPFISVSFSAVTAECDENKTWSKWTPSGNLTMSITNPACYNKFDPGKEYFLTIEEA